MADDNKFAMEMFDRASDRMVELGYAKIIVSRATGRKFYWTPLGQTLKIEAQRVFDVVMKDKGKMGDSEAMAMWLIFIQARDPIPPHEQ